MKMMTSMALAVLSAIQSLPSSRPTEFTKRTRIKTGKLYPHSSKRQQARYARQLAAGQLKFN